MTSPNVLFVCKAMGWPLQMFYLFVELRDDLSKCCSACFNRIARRLGTNPQTNEPLVPLVPENSDGK